MAAKFVSEAETELACPVCFHFYVTPHEPKNLPKCAHIFCQVCLQKMSGGLKTIKCPQCCKVSTLPKGGIPSLSTILVVRNLAERHPEGIKQRKTHIQQELNREKDQKTKRLMEIKESEKQTRKVVAFEEKEIDKSLDAVVTRTQELKKELRSTCGLTQIQQEIAQLEEQIASIETSQSKLETMTGDEFQIQTDALTNQLGKLQINESSQIYKDHRVGKFIPNVQLGRIVRPRRLELVQEFGEFAFATGIASKPNGLLAVCDSSSNPIQFTLYRNKNSQYKKHCNFKVLKAVRDAPLDIVLSQEDKYLVTKCAAGFDIYSKDGKYEKTVSVTDPKSGQKLDIVTGSITTTRDGRILAGSRIQAEDSVTRIVTAHDVAGTLLKTIPVSITPLRIASIRGTHVAVSNGHRGKVCVYDLQSGKETLNLDIPMSAGICYDEESECMLIGRFTVAKKDKKDIAVSGSGVIEQYCSVTGKHVASVAQELQNPIGISLTEDNMVLVTDKTTVKLYQMH